MTLQEILDAKGNVVHAIGSQAALRDAAKRLVRHNIGALLVVEGENSRQADDIRGIISERDLLHAYAAECESLDDLRVYDVMTTDVLRASPTDRVEDVMGVMTQRRIRHLPVVSDGRIAGIVSIGDVVKAQHAYLAIENRFMKDYITG
jgi:CBS domain-containing protein